LSEFLNGFFYCPVCVSKSKTVIDSIAVKLFDNHIFIEYNNQYYDPSYGTGPFNTKADWLNTSLVGHRAELSITNIPNPRDGFFYMVVVDIADFIFF